VVKANMDLNVARETVIMTLNAQKDSSANSFKVSVLSKDVKAKAQS
jgi:hypothetical protein